MTIPSISRFASSFCLSLRVKLPFPEEDEDCIAIGRGKRIGDRIVVADARDAYIGARNLRVLRNTVVIG
jgi:hypothetical protein